MITWLRNLFKSKVKQSKVKQLIDQFTPPASNRSIKLINYDLMNYDLEDLKKIKLIVVTDLGSFTISELSKIYKSETELYLAGEQENDYCMLLWKSLLILNENNELIFRKDNDMPIAVLINDTFSPNWHVTFQKGLI